MSAKFADVLDLILAKVVGVFDLWQVKLHPSLLYILIACECGGEFIWPIN